MKKIRAILFVACAAALLPCVALAQDKEAEKPAPPDIPGILKSLTIERGDAERGRVAAVAPKKGNCLACHVISSLDDKFQGTIGPPLDHVAERYTESQLRQLIVDARVFYPTTTMPPYFVDKGLYRVQKPYQGKPMLQPGEVEDIIAFLKTLR